MSLRMALIPLACGLNLLISAQTAGNDEFLSSLYDQLHDSPAQRGFREMAPMPYGVVFLPWKGVTEAQIRDQFHTMRRLGFRNLKQVMGSPEWPLKRLMEIALEEDVIPFWYGEAGWEPITSALVRKLGISSTFSLAQIRADPRMRSYQKEVLRAQIPAALAVQKIANSDPGQYKHSPDPYLGAEDVPRFQSWLRKTYKSVDELAEAWNEYEIAIDDRPFRTWEEVDGVVAAMPKEERGLGGYGGEYGRVRDVLRFKAASLTAQIEDAFRRFHKLYPQVPTRTGGEMGLFLPFAFRAINLEDLAKTQTDLGSFYPSIHLAWHFGEVQYEVARTVYMQASFANDLFKGGWAATWESTGGPQQLTGSKGIASGQALTTPGFSVTAGTITQLLLSYLAAGFKGAGIWTWNAREAGWEAGEYALLDRNRQVSERAIRAGKIAQAAERYRDELWQGHKEPLVGVLLNWDNDAIWAAISLRGRDHFKDYPMRARVGISRALIDANIPWEYVTISDLEAGLGPRYKIIYLAGQLSISERVLELLLDYAKQGGRVVMDSPGGAYDEHGKVLRTSSGSAFERLFGAGVADLQYSNNVRFSIGHRMLDGFISDLHTTHATTRAKFDSGEPAVTENHIGSGSAVLLGWDASFAVFRPGNENAEALLRKQMLGALTSPYQCDGALLYRLATPHADHYFFINDGAQRTVRLNTTYRYVSVVDPIGGQTLRLGDSIELEGYGGRWLRYQK